MKTNSKRQLGATNKMQLWTSKSAA